MKLDLEKTSREVYSVILKDLSAYGGFPFYGIVILGAVALDIFDFASSLILSLIVVTAVVACLRLAYFKPRPGMPRKKYSSIYERIDNSSFPSIHAARAVMISMAFYFIAPALLPVLLVLIAAVLLSRIHFKRHDFADLVAGCLLGLVLGYIFFM
jgi:undecaprenyl-diphosphatase